jgi:hypothetical protein
MLAATLPGDTQAPFAPRIGAPVLLTYAPSLTAEPDGQGCISARSLTYRLIKGADHGLSNEAWRNNYIETTI